jgi:hypothetical protein
MAALATVLHIQTFVWQEAVAAAFAAAVPAAATPLLLHRSSGAACAHTRCLIQPLPPRLQQHGMA